MRAPIGAAAGFTARHPFDYVWNTVVRHVVGGPALPPNPARRRHAFKPEALALWQRLTQETVATT